MGLMSQERVDFIVNCVGRGHSNPRVITTAYKSIYPDHTNEEIREMKTLMFRLLDRKQYSMVMKPFRPIMDMLEVMRAGFKPITDAIRRLF